MALAAFNTLTAIKKKMHNMKEFKETAFDRADQLEQKMVEHRAISEKVLHFFFLSLSSDRIRSQRQDNHHYIRLTEG